MSPLRLNMEIERWPLAAPFTISGYTFAVIDVLVVNLESNGQVGRGEAAGVYYRDDTPATAIKQIESFRGVIEQGIDRASLQEMLGPGGARNAVDCALWDLEAKLTARPAWQIAHLEKPRPLLTTFTCGADKPERMAATARAYASARAIKLKLTGEPIDAERVCAVREARADVWLGIDANQGFTREGLEQIMPVLVATRVALIEQPFPIGQDSLLEDFDSPIPIAADESVQSLTDVPGLLGRYKAVNIKLDKCGGLTAGLAMARTARDLGLEAMVGNMSGTSLGMAPAFLLGQLCQIVDLDGPLLLTGDRPITVQYTNGSIECREEVWGGPRGDAHLLPTTSVSKHD